MYEDIKAHRGLEIPFKDFENKYGKVNPAVIKGNPVHLTDVISLWGLQFLFPEDILTKDIIVALDILHKSKAELGKFKDKPRQQLSASQHQIKEAIRQKEFAQRAEEFAPVITADLEKRSAFMNFKDTPNLKVKYQLYPLIDEDENL